MDKARFFAATTAHILILRFTREPHTGINFAHVIGGVSANTTSQSALGGFPKTPSIYGNNYFPPWNRISPKVFKTAN